MGKILKSNLSYEERISKLLKARPVGNKKMENSKAFGFRFCIRQNQTLSGTDTFESAHDSESSLHSRLMHLGEKTCNIPELQAMFALVACLRALEIEGTEK